MLCVRYGAMTTASAAVYLLQRQVKRCSSSELRANLAKCLLYAINGGVDEKNKSTGWTKLPANYI